MAFSIRRRKGINVKAVVAKIAITVLVLYVGGTVLTEIGSVMNGTCSPFYQGLTLIGWTVGAGDTTACPAANTNTITATSGTGILTVVGLIAIASVVMEFVQVSF